MKDFILFGSIFVAMILIFPWLVVGIGQYIKFVTVFLGVE